MKTSREVVNDQPIPDLASENTPPDTEEAKLEAAERELLGSAGEDSEEDEMDDDTISDILDGVDDDTDDIG